MIPDDESSAVDPKLLDYLVVAAAAIDAERAVGALADPGWEDGCLELLDRTWPSAGTDPEVAPPPATIGRYQIIRELGRGGFGVVYLAYDPKMVREVALKVPLPGMADSSDVRRRFTREALAVAGLDHPNIVPIHDARTVGPVAYIISTYCPGLSLAAWLKDRAGPVPPRTAATITAALARGIEHAHTHGILHRDLKPANVMLGPGGDADSAGVTPRVTDFGLAKLADDSVADQTRTGVIIGSAPYMAPEQAAATFGEVGPATDVYALGATLYEILVGRPPFGGRSSAETLHQVLTLEPIPPQLLRRDIPRDLQTICLQALRKHPHHRYPSAAAFEADLSRFLDGQAIVARPPSLPERGWRWSRRHPVAATTAAAVVLLIVLLNLGMGWSNARLRTLNDQLRREVNRADRHAREVERQRKLVADREAITDRHLHAARLNLARQAIEAGQPERAQAVLSDASAAMGSRRRDFAWRHLWQLSRRNLALWGRHDGLITRVILSADGGTLASSDQQGQVALWDVATQTRRLIGGAPTGTAEQMAFSPDGRLLAVAGLATGRPDALPQVTIYAVATSDVLARLDLAGAMMVEQVGFDDQSRTLLAVVAERFEVRSVRAWFLAASGGPAASIQPRFRLDGGGGAVALTPGGRSFWTSGAPGQVHERAAVTGQPIRTLDLPAPRVEVFGLSGDGRFLAAAVAPTRVLLWDLERGGPPRVVADERIRPHQLLFTGDGASLLVITGGLQVRLIHLADGAIRELLPFDPNRRGLLHFAASPDGRWLASFGEYHPGGVQPLTLWDVATGRPAQTFAGRRKFAHGVFHPQSRSLLLGNDYDIAAWHPLLPSPRFERFDDHNNEVWSIIFSPDGATVATGGNDDRVRFWNPRTGARGPILAPHAATVSTLAWHPGGQIIASGSFDPTNNLKLWDARSGDVITNLAGHTDKVRSVAFSPDGKVLASAGTDRVVRIWEVRTGKRLAVLAAHTDLVRNLAFAPDGRSLASVGDDEVVRVWDWSRPQLLAVFAEPYQLSAVAYSPDGLTLASADQGGFIHLRDTTTWRTRRVVRSDDKEIRTLLFSPDGDTLVSAGASRTIRFWDPSTGQSLMELRNETSDQINALAFSPDGTLLVVADHGGRVLVLHGPPR